MSGVLERPVVVGLLLFYTGAGQAMNQDQIRHRITDQIVAALKSGGTAIPWRRPWSNLENTGMPANVVSRRCYSGINPLLLQMVAQGRGYASRYWATFNQWRSLGLCVKKRPDDVAPGQWGTRIVYCSPVTKVKKADDGHEKEERFFLLREYVVFNAEQVAGDGIECFLARPREQATFVDYEPAQRAIDAVGADIRYGGNRAFYSRDGDFIQIPPRESFEGAHEWYATHLHELAHFAEPRLNWQGSYALNELVAEIAACYLCAELGIPQSDDLSNHHSYLAYWLQELEQDHRAIFRASQQASKATDYLLSFSRGQNGEEADPAKAPEEAGAVA